MDKESQGILSLAIGVIMVATVLVPIIVALVAIGIFPNPLHRDLVLVGLMLLFVGGVFAYNRFVRGN